jgi:hypothetical protein
MLASWLDANRHSLEAKGVEASITYGETTMEPRAAWVDLDAGGRLARVIVWADWQGDAHFGDLVDGDVTVEHREGDAEVSQLPDMAVRWVLRQSRDAGVARGAGRGG